MSDQSFHSHPQNHPIKHYKQNNKECVHIYNKQVHNNNNTNNTVGKY